jgi:hypothetical protein
MVVGMKLGWSRPCGLVVALPLLACGPSPGTGDDEHASSETSSGDDGGTPSCPAVEPGVELSFRAVGVLDEAAFEDRPCTVSGLAPSDDGFELALECLDGNGSLDVSVSPAVLPVLAIGDEVSTTVTAPEDDAAWESRRSVFLRDPVSGALELAAVFALDPAWTGELSPLQLEAIPDACASGPDESDCLTGRRQMWNATFEGSSEIVGDHLRAQLGEYVVQMGSAFDGELLECVDVDTSTYGALVVRTQ